MNVVTKRGSPPVRKPDGVRAPPALGRPPSMSQKKLSDYRTDDGQCPTCGNTFDSSLAMKVHHYNAHGERLVHSRDCEVCGEEFEVRSGREDTNRFCSRECWDERRPQRQTVETKTVVCEWCGDTFERKPYHPDVEHQFCSAQCCGNWKSENIVGKSHPLRNRIVLSCEQCGEEFDVIESRASTARFCSQDCLGQWRSENATGQDNPNWKGGSRLTSALRKQLADCSWESIAETVRDETNHLCEMCGQEERFDGSLDVHHIIPLKAGGTNDRYNLIALCSECHIRVERNTEQLDEVSRVIKP